MSCTSGRAEFWAELVSAYHDGELSADQAAEVERHLADCQTCAEWLEHLRSDQAEMVAAGTAPGRPGRSRCWRSCLRPR
jgi:anti-sigma factor RsiW